MFLFDFFRSFLPLHNPMGFGAGDFIELALVTLLVSLVLLRARIEPGFQRLAARTGWTMLLLAALPVALRLLLLPRHPVPTPAGADSFSYLLLADTLRHFRLANRCIRCTSSSKRSLSSSIPVTVPSIRSARAWRWRSGGRSSAIPGPGWFFPWRPSARCATGCCGVGQIGRAHV